MKRSSFYFLILLSLFFYTNELKANDTCYVHLDKSFYVTGETIWYKLYLPSSFKQHSSIIKVDFVNSKARSIDSYYIASEGKLAVSGYWEIPIDLASDYYTLAFTALLQEGKKKMLLAKVGLPIYNDLTALPDAGKEKTAPVSKLALNYPLKIELVIDQKSHSRRSQITGRIKVLNAEEAMANTTISISVQDWELMDTISYPMLNLITGETIPKNLPELLDTAIYLRGQVLDANAQATASPVLGIYIPKEEQFYYTKTQEDFYFNLKLKQFYGKQAIQLIDFQKGPVKSLLEEYVPEPIDANLSYSSAIKAYLELSRSRKKISQIFSDLEGVQVEEGHLLPIQSPTADASYSFSDYQNFKDLPSFFREIATPFKFRKKKDGSYFTKMYNASLRKYYKGEPLIIIDGKITPNTDFLANIPFAAFKTVDIFYDPKRLRASFGPLGLNGVASFSTHKRKTELPNQDEESIIEIQGLQINKNINGRIAKTTSHHPILSPQIYWNPNLTTNPEGIADFRFQHTDDLGVFLINIVVRDQNGKMGTARLKYEVK